MKTKDKTDKSLVPVSMKTEYMQDNDSCDDGKDGQTLEVFTQDAGGGNYIVIKTERWAIEYDDIDDLCNQLKKLILETRSLFEE